MYKLRYYKTIAIRKNTCVCRCVKRIGWIGKATVLAQYQDILTANFLYVILFIIKYATARKRGRVLPSVTHLTLLDLVFFKKCKKEQLRALWTKATALFAGKASPRTSSFIPANSKT